MELREFFSLDAVELDLKGSSKDEILKELIGLLIASRASHILMKSQFHENSKLKLSPAQSQCCSSRAP